MILKFSKYITIFCLALVCINPLLVYAQNTNQAPVGTDPNSTTGVVQYKGVDQSISTYLCTPSDPPDGNDLQRCVNKLYRFSIAFGAIAVVFFIVIAGYMYITGGEGAKTKAKGMIQNSIVGVALLLGSYLILSFINPNLTIYKPIQPPIFSAAELPSCAEIGFGNDCSIALAGSDQTVDTGTGRKLFACGKQFTSADAGKNITTVSFKVWDQGVTKNMSVQVNQCIAARVKKAFDQYYADSQKFPIHSVGGFNIRNVAGTSSLSAHSFGLAIDINSQENCHYGSKGGSGGCYPPGTSYNPGSNPYSITTSSSIYKAMKANGLGWGGQWHSSKDYMHFSCTENEQGVCN